MRFIANLLRAIPVTHETTRPNLFQEFQAAFGNIQQMTGKQVEQAYQSVLLYSQVRPKDMTPAIRDGLLDALEARLTVFVENSIEFLSKPAEEARLARLRSFRTRNQTESPSLIPSAAA